VAAFLKEQGIAARAYHADLEGGERIGAERLLWETSLSARGYRSRWGWASTNLIWDLSSIFNAPAQSLHIINSWASWSCGRFPAFGVLLSGREDDEIQDYFIRTAFPPAKVLEDVVRGWERATA